MRYQLSSERHGVRTSELTEQAVDCPGARDETRQTNYGVKARPGNWIVFRAGDGDINVLSYGRVLGKVNAPAIEDSRYPCQKIEGWISAVVLSDSMTHAFVHWVNPQYVVVVRDEPPVAMLAWISGPMPRPDDVHRMATYGTLAEPYIAGVPERLNVYNRERRESSRQE